MLHPYHVPRRLPQSSRRRLGTLQFLMLAAALFSVLALVWLANGMKSSKQRVQLPHPTAGGLQGSKQAGAPLSYPLWWHAPFVTNSGEHQCDSDHLQQGLLLSQQLLLGPLAAVFCHLTCMREQSPC